MELSTFYGFGEIVLPFALNFFEGRKNGNDIALSWSTSFEVDVDYYGVYYSLDSINFSTLGFVEGNGTSNEAHHYSFTHKTPSHGDNYYRLRQFKHDGSFENSKIINVQSTSVTDIKIYPNPTRGSLYFDLEEIISIQIINEFGDVQKFSPANEIDISHLRNGVYFVRVFADTGVIQKRIFKLD
jgi:hypothetical protein